jgi:hypothetical protein
MSLFATWAPKARVGAPAAAGLRKVSKPWFILVLLFCQVCCQCLSKIFYLWSSCCLFLHSSPSFHVVPFVNTLSSLLSHSSSI